MNEKVVIHSGGNAPPPTLETLTQEIKAYIWASTQNAFAIGKRLIQAKKLVQHGEWANWLETNFDFKVRMAQKLMAIAERFSETSNSTNTPSTALFDISTFNQTQLTELLAVPKVAEQKFFDEIKAAGKSVESMTAKQLRQEIKSFKSKYTKDKSTADKPAVIADNSRADIPAETAIVPNIEPVVTVPLAEFEALKAEVEKLRGEVQKWKDKAKYYSDWTQEDFVAEIDSLKAENKFLREQKIDYERLEKIRVSLCDELAVLRDDNNSLIVENKQLKRQVEQLTKSNEYAAQQITELRQQRLVFRRQAMKLHEEKQILLDISPHRDIFQDVLHDEKKPAVSAGN